METVRLEIPIPEPVVAAFHREGQPFLRGHALRAFLHTAEPIQSGSLLRAYTQI
jgi:hypothetical protein